MKRRSLLKSIGAIIGVGVIGKTAEAIAAPPVVTPVAPHIELKPYTLGSATAFHEPLPRWTIGQTVYIDSSGYLVTSDNVRWNLSE